MIHIDTRKEEITVDYLLRGVQHRMRNKKGSSIISFEDIESLDNIELYGDQPNVYDNINLSPELYFSLDYASKVYDPRSVPGNTRFYKAKKLMMRFFRLYATRQVEFNAAILKISNRFFDIFHDILEKFEYFRKAEVRMHKRIERNEKITRNTNKRLDVQRSRLEYVEDFDIDISFLRQRVENVESFEREIYLVRQRIESLENWEKDINFQRDRIEKLETWEKDYNVQRDRIEKLETWDKNFNNQRDRIEKLETWDKNFNNQRDRIEKLETWDKNFNNQRNRIEELEKWEKKFNNQRNRIEELEKWEKKFNNQRGRIEKLENWEDNFNNQRNRIEELEKWEEKFNNQRNRIEELEKWEDNFNNQRYRIEGLEKWEKKFNNQRNRIEGLEKWEKKFNNQRSRIEKLEKWENNFNSHRDRIEELEKWEENLNNQRNRIEELEKWEDKFNNQRNRIEDLETWDEKFNCQRNRLEDLEKWEGQFNNQRNRLEDLEKWEKDFNIQRKRFEELEKTNRKLNERLLPLENLKENFEIIFNENTVLRQRLGQSIIEAKTKINISGKNKTSPSHLNSSNIHNDYLYFPYLNTDRAIESVVKKLIKPYVSFFSKTKVNKNISNPFIIDIGCGRGEFLDSCREAKLPVKGIDINEDMVSYCKTKKHDVVLSDAVSYLNSLENNSVKGIFACHVIEHMMHNQLLEFLRLCSSKLASGGRLVLETPNPTSFFALSMFYRDFTHKQPIHPKTISFLLEKLSFQNIEIKEIHPAPDKYKLKSKLENNILENKNIEKLNNTLYGYLDYSVLATK